jgi:O-antigen ligase
LRGTYETAEVFRLIKWAVTIVYIPTIIGFLGKVGVGVPYFIAAVDYGNQCLPIVLIIAAGVLFNFLRARTLLAFLFFMPLFVLIVSGTRTYWIGTVAGLSVLYFLKTWHSPRRSVKGVFLLAGVLAISIYVAVAGFPFENKTMREVTTERRLEQRVEFLKEGRISEEQSVDARLDESSRVIQSIQNWAFGNGLGEKVLIDTKEGYGIWDLVEATWFHNAYLFFLLKMGLLGLGVFLILIFLLFRLGYQTFRMTTGFEKALSAFFIAFLTSASVMSLSTGNFLSPRCWLVLGIFGGVLANVRGRLKLSVFSISRLPGVSDPI